MAGQTNVKLEASLLPANPSTASLWSLGLVPRLGAVAAPLVVVVLAVELSWAVLVLRRHVVRRSAEVAPLASRSRSVLGDVEPQRTAGNLSSVELLNCLLRVRFVSETNEREAAGSAALAVFRDVNVDDLANLAEQLTELLVRRGKVEVSYEYLA
jgi:hypothetical protein